VDTYNAGMRGMTVFMCKNDMYDTVNVCVRKNMFTKKRAIRNTVI